MPLLQFQPLASQPTPQFWAALAALKLDKLKLDDSVQDLSAWLEEGRTVVDRSLTGGGGGGGGASGGVGVGVDGAFGLGGGAFDGSEKEQAGSITVHGKFKNFNTIEEFKKTETKKELFDAVVDEILASFESDTPTLNPFLLVTFADLKKYTYHYWFAFPALVAKPAWEVEEDFKPADEEFVRLIREAETLNGSKPLSYLIRTDPSSSQPPSFASLSQYTTFFATTPKSHRFVIFHDPSSLPSNPGWPLRNVLFYLNKKHGVKIANVVCLRSGAGASRVGVVRVGEAEEVEKMEKGERPSAVGWERNKAGKLMSRLVDLAPMMDPTRLADQAVDLNLKLMRWRIMPALDLDKIASTKCLLLGAGTLGCYVARALMGWGIRNITFVDSAKVSYSNPVRQPLFDFEDCLDGGKPKAQCAADKLKKIFPGVNATAHSFMIPMPGHPISSSSLSQTTSDISLLDTLIETHDVVFLLMDSRESRWLPTVIGASKGKIVINAALGFDGYLVMRHGANTVGEDGKRLGCYYCNDIVAPADSLTDRTLDQMCTVTRPGVAPIASATAVELLVSLIQHPLGIHAPAEGTPGTSYEHEKQGGSPLGTVPHQLRGALGQWKTMLIEGAAFDRCTGCSQVVIDAYRQQGVELVLSACNEAEYLQKLTGLDKLYEEGEAVLDSVDWEEGDEDDM